jgi:exonuclease III
MNENLKIASANIRSLKKIEKILYLHDICEKNNIDILFIQETHLNEVIFQNEIKKVFKNYMLSSNFTH